MNQFRFSNIEDQLSSLQTELEATFKTLSTALDDLYGRVSDLKEAAGNVNCVQDIDDEDNHTLVEKAYDDYEGVLEDVKDKINNTISELDDHMKMCSDLRSDLVRLTAETNKREPSI